jgi:uncharacterized protein YjbI with pentapeptide repeats
MIRLACGATSESGRRHRVAGVVGLVPARGSGTLAGLSLAMIAAAMMVCGSAAAATTPRADAPSYLFSIPTASGSLTGRNDQHLTLRLAGARDYLTRFTDRPVRQAFVVANVDFARRFRNYFASAAPNAVLTYTPRGAQIPVSIVLTIKQPRWNAQHATWTFSATRIRKQPDNLPDATVHIKPPFLANPRTFSQATLLIDDATNCFLPYSECQGVDLAGERFLGGADLDHIDLSGANISNAGLDGSDLSDADLTNANLSYSQVIEAILTGANLSRANLHDTQLDSDNLTDANLSGAILTGATLTDYAGHTNLTGANLTGANLNGAELMGANLTDADFTDATNANFAGAVLCNTVMPNGTLSGC